MKLKIKDYDLDLSKEELIDFLSTATYSDSTFELYVNNKNKKYIEDKDPMYIEEEWAEVLISGGYVSAVDLEDECDTKEEAKGSETSKALEVKGTYRHGSVYYPIYHISLERIKESIIKVLSGEIKEDDFCLIKSVTEIFLKKEGDYDFYYAWNFLQYVIFGEIIYG